MAARPYTIEEYVRWSDVDFAGIICYGAYLRFFEIAETELFRAAGLAFHDVFIHSDDRLVAALTQVSLFDRFFLFARGAIDSKDLVFFALFIGFFLFLTLLSLESRHWRGIR